MPLLKKSNELLTFNFFWAFPASLPAGRQAGGPRFPFYLFLRSAPKKDKFILSGVEGLLSLTQCQLVIKNRLTKNCLSGGQVVIHKLKYL